MRNIADKAIRMTWISDAYKSAGDEDQFIIDYFDGKRGGYLLDIAAACPVSGSLSFKLLDSYEWFGILVEPSIVHKENIEACYGDVDGVHFFNGAVHREFEEVTLSEYSGVSVGHSNILGKGGTNTYTVPSLSINKLLEKYDAPNDIDFVNLDIEGSELEIIECLDYQKYNVRLFCIENGIIYKDLMEKKGYKICNHDGYNLFHGNLFFEKV